jgi:hydrogenase nickel incorporation protein HypA/HybF
MHEMALAARVVEIAAETLRDRAGPAAKLAVVHVAIGRLSHVEPRALAFCFEAAARGTPVEGARLAIAQPEGSGFCLDCRAVVPLASRVADCPRCGGVRLVVTGGEEMRVTELELQ